MRLKRRKACLGGRARAAAAAVHSHMARKRSAALAAVLIRRTRAWRCRSSRAGTWRAGMQVRTQQGGGAAWGASHGHGRVASSAGAARASCALCRCWPPLRGCAPRRVRMPLADANYELDPGYASLDPLQVRMCVSDDDDDDGEVTRTRAKRISVCCVCLWLRVCQQYYASSNGHGARCWRALRAQGKPCATLVLAAPPARSRQQIRVTRQHWSTQGRSGRGLLNTKEWCWERVVV